MLSFLVGALFGLIGSRPLFFGYAADSLWLFRVGVVTVVASVLHLVRVAPLVTTLPYLSQLPLFPIFQELGKGSSGLKFDLTSLLSLYWILLAWCIESAGVPAWFRHMMDHTVFVVSWCYIVVAIYRGDSLIRFHRGKRQPLSVLFAAIPAIVTRFLPAPSGESLMYELLFYALQAYSLRCVTVFLAACQADEISSAGKYAVRWALLFRFIPHVDWVEEKKRSSKSKKLRVASANWIYLDHNATTPLDKRVERSMREALGNWGNPGSATGPFARAAREAIAKAKSDLAALIACERPDQLIITSGGTESNSTVLHSVLAGPARKRCITSPFEHPAVEQVLANMPWVDWIRVPVDLRGIIDRDAFVAELKQGAHLVSIMWANNEVGSVQPIHELVKLARAHAPNALFHSDAAQAVGKVPVSVGDLDFLTVAAHKFYGPKAVGALYHRVAVTPLLRGGSQQQGRRAGTESALQCVGLGSAAYQARVHFDEHAQVMRNTRDHMWSLVKDKFPRARRWTPLGESDALPNTLSVCLDPEGPPANDLVRHCEPYKLLFSAGAACHAGSYTPSASLLALGVEPSLALRTIRLSTGAQTTLEQVTKAVDILASALSQPFATMVLPWTEAEKPAMEVRTKVFIEEQGIDPAIEVDTDGDRRYEHVVAKSHDGVPIGAARLLPDGHVGRMCVLKSWRRRGVGRSMMLALEERARLGGLSRVQLNAQLSAKEFYEALGYQPKGSIFQEAGIAHIAMEKPL